MQNNNEISLEDLHQAIHSGQFNPLPHVEYGTQLVRRVFDCAMKLKRVPFDSSLIVRDPETGERILNTLDIAKLADPAINHAIEALGIPYVLPDDKG